MNYKEKLSGWYKEFMLVIGYCPVCWGKLLISKDSYVCFTCEAKGFEE